MLFIKTYICYSVKKKLSSASDLENKFMASGGRMSKRVVFIGRTDTKAEAPIFWPPNAKN